MKRFFPSIILLLILLCSTSCNDNFNRAGEGILEGEVRIELKRSSGSLVVSRAVPDNSEETVENVAVFVFDKSGNVSESFTQSSAENIRYIDVFLEANDDALYIVANHPSPEELVANVKTLNDLKEASLTIESASGAFHGKYVMTGNTPVSALAASSSVELRRIAAHLSFTIRIDTTPKKSGGGSGPDAPQNELGGDGGDFKVSAAYLCQVPKGSYLLERSDDNTLNSQQGDFVYQSDPAVMRGNYFESVRLPLREESDGSLTASFDMFENRRGGMDNTNVNNWPELLEMKDHELYEGYKQIYKRKRAMDYPSHIGKIEINKTDQNDVLFQKPEVKESQFYNASYLRIDGIYKKKEGGLTYNTSYYIYLGHNAVSDYNLRRNHWYDNEIIIRSFDNFDHRVRGEGLNGLTVHAPDPEPLDAHFNAVKVLMYSVDDWTVSVENPDATPWLEVSHSGTYVPRLHGVAPTGKEAAFSISGTAGLNYFYIHTDEYIPNIDRVEQNITQKNRIGKVVCRSGKSVKEITVEQMPAQLVVLDLRDDILFHDVYYSFFIERKLEQQYMPWGFYRYWCWIFDLQITKGLWNGLENTKIMRKVALDGDYNDLIDSYIDPAYPDGLPYDHAIGYIVAKNRDRNGNGKIDDEEIVWYWPSTKELKAIYSAKTQGWLDFEGKGGEFHSSTPSSADPVGITVGLSNIVKMSNGKTALTQRDRKHNLIGCRLKEHSPGKPGTGDGHVTTDPNWDGGEEVIIPRMK